MRDKHVRNSKSRTSSNKPTAAYILSLLGVVLGLLVSLALIIFGVGFGVWMIITSVLVIVFARKLNANPMEHTKWGALILVFSIIGVGGLFAFIGGILALVYKPILVGAQPQYAPQQQNGAPPQNYAPPPQQQWGQPQQSITRIQLRKSSARKPQVLPQLR